MSASIATIFRHEGGAGLLAKVVFVVAHFTMTWVLMVGLFIPLFVGCPVILTKPRKAFIRKHRRRWCDCLLNTRHHFRPRQLRIHLAVFTPKGDMAGLDLGHVNTIINGAEQAEYHNSKFTPVVTI